MDTSPRPQPPSATPLAGRVAVVTGATRGAGRGIAAALGEAGATVICTGRSTRGPAGRSEYDRPETVEETAELVTDLGGVGVAEVVDHLDPRQVGALAERIRHDHGRIDVLVDDIWGGEALKGGPPDWDRPIWELDLADGLHLLRLAVETHLVTAHTLLPLLVEAPGGLLVEVSDGTTAYNASHYRISAFYDLAKVAVNRLAWSLGHEVEPFGATAVAVTPGWMRSEMMLDVFGVTEDDWRSAVDPGRAGGPTAPPGFAVSESPRYVGRAIAAMAADPDRARWHRRSVEAGELAEHYGVTDLDGSTPQAWRFMAAEEAGEDPDPEAYR
jgi:NAD(P)-dependent dehydrogenase (short-subunit alcohol dehydrogenase family)